MASSNYSTQDAAKNAVSKLTDVIDGLRVNNLNAYVDNNSQVRKDFIRDENYILDRMNQATNAAYNQNRAQAIQDAIAAEDTSYANTRNAISEMRRNLIGSGSSGANVGAANATALQALLGLGQQNTQTTTDSLRAINDVNRERASQLAQNAVEAINTANDATGRMYDAATSAYGSDRSYAAQGAADALGSLTAAIDTAASQERMNNATNQTNLDIENTVKRTENVNKNTNKDTVKTTSTNTNKNYNTDKSTSTNYNYNSDKMPKNKK